jgi:hypothetical protein
LSVSVISYLEDKCIDSDKYMDVPTNVCENSSCVGGVKNDGDVCNKVSVVNLKDLLLLAISTRVKKVDMEDVSGEGEGSKGGERGRGG